ncbi:MAG: 50S ribosomal protein L18e [Promethearchaeota archaeon]|nr:MAG: 50S ribosomal protein L18e [Candidatus Lokiarchaeota archaeon]
MVVVSHKITGPSNYYVRKLIRELWKTRRNIWRTLSKKLSGARKNRVEANLKRINNKTKAEDVIVVPGKVLGVGDLDHKLTIACLDCSRSAREKILKSGSTLLSIEELLADNPEGSGVKIFY